MTSSSRRMAGPVIYQGLERFLYQTWQIITGQEENTSPRTGMSEEDWADVFGIKLREDQEIFKEATHHLSEIVSKHKNLEGLNKHQLKDVVRKLGNKITELDFIAHEVAPPNLMYVNRASNYACLDRAKLRKIAQSRTRAARTLTKRVQMGILHVTKTLNRLEDKLSATELKEWEEMLHILRGELKDGSGKKDVEKDTGKEPGTPETDKSDPSIEEIPAEEEEDPLVENTKPMETTPVKDTP